MLVEIPRRGSALQIIGLLFPPLAGHLNPMATLGRALCRRGFRVVAFQLPGMRSRIEDEDLEFWPLGLDDQTAELESRLARLGGLSGFSGMRFTLDCGHRYAELVLQHAPAAVAAVNPLLLVVDANDPAGGAVAEHAGVPFVTVGSLPLNREPDMPPPFVPWPYDGTLGTRLKNRLAYHVFDFLVRRINATVNESRRIWNLAPIRTPDDSFSRLAQIFQTTDEFDFPRRNKPANFHAVGLLFDKRRPPISFPYERLGDRPLIYASFGSVLNRGEATFRAVIDACAGLGVQLVLSAGPLAAALNARALPDFVIAVPFAPQLELLARATVCVTHGGLNTVAESLRFGVPMVAVPVMNDQPAVAARVKWTGCGEIIEPAKLTASGLRRAIERILQQPSYRQNALLQKRAIEQAGGVQRAADIITSIALRSVRQAMSA
jgi:zeaxanthin glucosyltransferase